MKTLITALFLALGVALNAGAQNQLNKSERPIPWYLERYPYIQYKGIVYSFENQFDWPSEFTRVDSAKLTPFQFWVSYLPLWFKQRSAGSLKHGTVHPADSISRVVHLPWRTIEFSDRVIPFHLWADYLFIQGRDDELRVITSAGDTLTFDRFLSNKVAYGPRGEIRWQPAERRAPTEEEYDKYVGLIARNTNYRSLITNSVPIGENDVMPGDIYVTCDSAGVKGRVAVALVAIENSNGHRLYIFGTGCPESCDFYIPLFNGRRDYPWTTPAEVAKLMSAPAEISGFYRLNLPTTGR